MATVITDYPLCASPNSRRRTYSFGSPAAPALAGHTRRSVDGGSSAASGCGFESPPGEARNSSSPALQGPCSAGIGPGLSTCLCGPCRRSYCALRPPPDQASAAARAAAAPPTPPRSRPRGPATACAPEPAARIAPIQGGGVGSSSHRPRATVGSGSAALPVPSAAHTVPCTDMGRQAY